jgi:hypothetical protein
MKERPTPGQKVTNLALPGDEQSVVDWLTAQAIRRDDRQTPRERMALHHVERCEVMRRRWGREAWPCTRQHPCHFCQWVSEE